MRCVMYIFTARRSYASAVLGVVSIRKIRVLARDLDLDLALDLDPQGYGTPLGHGTPDSANFRPKAHLTQQIIAHA